MSLSHLVSETLNLFIKKYCNLRFKETCLFHQCAVARITQRLYLWVSNQIMKNSKLRNEIIYTTNSMNRTEKCSVPHGCRK